jgi:Ca-activated chloride channel family protein
VVRGGVAAVLLPALLLAGGGHLGCAPHPDPGGRDGHYTLRVLAVGELADMRPILDDAARATGVTVAITVTATRDGARTIANGRADGSFDASWLPSDRYLAMFDGGLARTDASSEIMSTPVVLGLRTSVVRRLGWDRPGRAPLTWAAVADAAAGRRFTFGMSDPDSSNSSLSALVSAATSIAGTGAALRQSDIARTAPRLRGLHGAQTLTAASSRELADAYLRRQAADRQSPGVDGLVSYESDLLALNVSGRLDESLTLLYPTDGVSTATYPLTLLASAPTPAKDAYRRLVRYLRAPAVQRRIADVTLRRPAVADPGGATHDDRQLVELPFPASLDVLDSLVAAYRGT